MSLRWDEAMVLGIDEIDDQHKTVIEKFTWLSEDGMVYDLYGITGDEGGPRIFVPNEPCIGTEFRRTLANLSGTAPSETESPNQTNGGEDA